MAKNLWHAKNKRPALYLLALTVNAVDATLAYRKLKLLAVSCFPWITYKQTPTKASLVMVTYKNNKS